MLLLPVVTEILANREGGKHGGCRRLVPLMQPLITEGDEISRLREQRNARYIALSFNPGERTI